MAICLQPNVFTLQYLLGVYGSRLYKYLTLSSSTYFTNKNNSLIYFVENRLKLFPTFDRNVTTILLIVETESNWIPKAIRNRTTRKTLRAIWNRPLRNNRNWVWIIWRKYFSCCYLDTAFHHLRSSLKYYSTILKTDFQMRIK